MSPKILIIFASICLVQTTVSASATTPAQFDLATYKSSGIQPRGFISCIPRLWEIITTVWDVNKFMGKFSTIHSELRKAIDKCKKITNEKEEKKCREAAEKEAQEKSQKLWDELRALVPRILTLMNKLRLCFFG